MGESRDQDEDGADDPDRLVARDQANQHGADHHQEDRQQKGGLAPLHVADAADHDAAERAREEADTEAANVASSSLVGSPAGKKVLRDGPSP